MRLSNREDNNALLPIPNSPLNLFSNLPTARPGNTYCAEFKLTVGTPRYYGNFTPIRPSTNNEGYAYTRPTPESFPGLSVWYDAADVDTLTLDSSGAVSAWADKSGSGRNALQAVADKRPGIKSYWKLNGVACPRFDGINDDLVTAAFTLNQPTTIFVAYSSMTDQTATLVDGAGGRNQLYLSAVTNTLSAFAGTALNGSAATTRGNANVATGVFDGASSYVRHNAAQSATADVGSSNLSGGFVLGTASDGLYRFNGMIAEVLVYDRALTTTQIIQIEDYLGRKWRTSYQSPANIPNLALWLDASEASTLVLDSTQKLSQLTDKSGNNRHFTQSTAANRPTVPALLYGDKPAVYFSGSSQLLSSSATWNDLGDNTAKAITEFYVLRWNAESGTVFVGEGDATGHKLYAYYGAGGAYYDGGLQNTARVTGNADSRVLTGQIITAQRDSGNVRLWYGDNLVATRADATGNLYAGVSNTVRFSAPAAGTAELAEVLVYKSALTTDQIASVRAHLKAKWLTTYSSPAGLAIQPALWLDAASPETIALDASNMITAWIDKSGNERHAGQTTAANRPSFTSAVQLNGRNVPSFDGINDFLKLPAFPVGAYTLFVVAQRNWTGTVGGYRTMFGNGIGPYSGFGLTQTPVNGPSAASGDIYAQAGGFDLPNPRVSGPVPASVGSGAAVITVRLGEQPLRLSMNGLQIQREGFASPAAVTVESKPVYIGADAPGTQSRFNGPIAEIILYAQELSDAEILQVEAYLTNKWISPYALDFSNPDNSQYYVMGWP